MHLGVWGPQNNQSTLLTKALFCLVSNPFYYHILR
jgi:hypothetical protein